MRRDITFVIGQHQITVSVIDQRIINTTETSRFIRRKETIPNLVQCLFQFRNPFVIFTWLIIAVLDFRHLFRRIAENENIVGTDTLHNLDIRAVKRPDRQCTIRSQLHVTGTGGFRSRHGNLLGQVRRRDNHFSQTDTVIRNEHHLQPIADILVVIDFHGNIVDQLDDVFRHLVSRSRLACKNDRTWHPVHFRVGLDLVIPRNDMQYIEQLPLVFMNPLDLDIKQ